VAFFNAYEPSNGNELWRTDGTTDGTRLIEDVIPGAESSNPAFTQIDSIYFLMSANTSDSKGRELWRYDFEPSMLVTQTSVIADGSTFDFGTLPEGTLSSEKTFTIKNNGDATLTLTGSPVIIIAGTNPSDFVATQPALTSLDAGKSVTFTITFASTTSSTKTATVEIPNNYSGAASFTFNVTGARVISSIEEPDALLLKVYPNPASEIVTISFPDAGETYTVEVFNSIGALMNKFETTQAEYKLPVSNLNNGFYILRIHKNKSLYIKKITVRK